MLRAAEVTPLPEAPPIVLGILDLQGEVIPVVDLRRRFRLPVRKLQSCDQFVVARAGTLRLALAVDGTEGVIEADERDLVPKAEIVSGLGYLEAVTRTEQGLVMIHDLESLLFPAEEELLLQALERLKP